MSSLKGQIVVAKGISDDMSSLISRHYCPATNAQLSSLMVSPLKASSLLAQSRYRKTCCLNKFLREIVIHLGFKSGEPNVKIYRTWTKPLLTGQGQRYKSMTPEAVTESEEAE
ncbi:hypothetical protein LXL04_010003 [Taraxacum kok-saghyz]